MLMLLLENTNMIYSSYYQIGLNDNTNNTVSTNNNNNANLTNDKNDLKYSESHQKHFLLCESCLWCATYLLNYGDVTIINCPICDNPKVESLPIANNEVYKIDYNSLNGFTFEFGITNMKRS
jgi:hypothetical protein